MGEKVIFSDGEIEIIDTSEYYEIVDDCYSNLPPVAQPLLQKASIIAGNIKEKLVNLPSFVQLVAASMPVESFRAVLTPDQQNQIAMGALKLLSKKDGTLLASLVNPKTGKIVSNVSLEKIKTTPELSRAITDFSTQMQMAEIAEGIQQIQIAIEEVRQGQENDRLALAYSCEQKLLQAMAMKNLELRTNALLSIAMSAEDSRNLLMLSQNANLEFIKSQPTTFWEKFFSKSEQSKVNQRMDEIRMSLQTVNMVSLSQAMAYHELGEDEAAKLSLKYYAEYIQSSYLSVPGLTERLDSIDPSPKKYWSEALPYINTKIQALPCYTTNNLIEGEK